MMPSLQQRQMIVVVLLLLSMLNVASGSLWGSSKPENEDPAVVIKVESTNEPIVETPSIKETVEKKMQDAKDTVQEKTQAAKESVSETASNIQGKASDVKESIVEKVRDVYDTIAEKASQVYNRVSEAGSQAKDQVSEAPDRISGKVDEIKHAVSDKASDVSQKVSEAYNMASQKTTEAKDALDDNVVRAKDEATKKTSEMKEKIRDLLDDFLRASGDARDKMVEKVHELGGHHKALREYSLPVTYIDSMENMRSNAKVWLNDELARIKECLEDSSLDSEKRDELLWKKSLIESMNERVENFGILHKPPSAVVHLDRYTLPKVVKAFDASLVRFCRPNQLDDKFELFAKWATSQDKLLVAEVPIQDRTDGNCAQKWGITTSNLPVILLTKQGQSPVIFEGDMTALNLRDFVHKETGLWLGGWARLQAFDDYAKQFMNSLGDMRNKVMEKAREALGMLKDDEKSSGNTYLEHMESISKDGKEWIQKELDRLKELAKDPNTTPEEKENCRRRHSVLQAFRDLSDNLKDEL